jgi:predicted GIY-YIG superfamily endonuclease
MEGSVLSFQQSLQRTFQRCFLSSYGSFGEAVSMEKNFKNQPIRNKNSLWWPYLLTDRDEMSNFYRGPSIDASYQVSVHLAKRSVNFSHFNLLL